MSDTKLTYTVLPGSVYYTRDNLNPSRVLLTIGGSNATDEAISIVGFEIQVPVNSVITSKDALTADPSSIVPVSLQPLDWDFQQVDDGLYRATPIDSDATIAPGQSITFQLQNIIVNQSDGTAILKIRENSGDGSFPEDSKQVVKIRSKLDITSFNPNPAYVSSGASSTLSWTTEAAARVTLAPGDYTNVKPNDEVIVQPGRTTVYTLTAYGEGPNVSKQITVSINPPEIKKFDPSAGKVDAGAKVTLSWQVDYADKIMISPGDHKDLPAQGTLEVQVWNATNFILTASNKGNEYANKTAPVGINPVVINSFTANPGYGARLGQPIALSWDVRSAVSATVQYGTINGISQDKLNNGVMSIIPNSGVAYTLMVNNELGMAMRSLELLPMPLGWNQFTSSAPFGFPELPLVLNFNTAIWVMASNYMNSVYRSFDGYNWIPVTNNVPWPTRSYAAGTVFNGKMWLMGGLGTDGSYRNDVWSSTDGNSWTQETAQAQWSARRSFGCFVLNNKMYIVAGLNSGSQPLTDVWSSSDGKTWTQVTGQAFQNGRSAFGTVVYNGKAWVLGGVINGDDKTGKPVNEVWSSSDGASWYAQTGIKWAPRAYPVVGALSNGIYLGSGLGADKKGLYDMNRMSSDNKWSTQRGFQWKDILNTAGVEYQDALWFLGGAQLNVNAANQNVWAYTPSV
ncbi:Kelch repeat-containing protein [Taibaiella koreensis]|uniref:hypothetical protein n=1 Tax=Taibaiella koreensis TaxID=1268548 RepID=UPI000E59A9C2|nr:hypothetical protein [Taibaiella koreensis]